MGLKAIKDVLEHARYGHETTRALDREAQVELEALVKAIRTLGVNGCLTAIADKGHEDEIEAVAVLKAIAKEAA